MSKSVEQHTNVPPRPQAPSPEECCGGGCVPCIYDYYYEALEKWEATVAVINGTIEAE